jgi:hypothetical protein
MSSCQPPTSPTPVAAIDRFVIVVDKHHLSKHREAVRTTDDRFRSDRAHTTDERLAGGGSLPTMITASRTSTPMIQELVSTRTAALAFPMLDAEAVTTIRIVRTSIIGTS